MDYDFGKWYENVYPQLTDCGMWLRGNELNSLPKEEYGKRPFRVLFTRLSPYKDVVTSYTHLLLYQLAAGMPDVFPDICYLPPENDSKIFARDKTPWLLGTQTKFGADRFSLIAFSNAIVQELINIPAFLKTSNIPLKRSERMEKDDIPLVLLGGSNAAYSTSIWGKDSWVDAVYVGYDAANIKKILQLCADGLKNKNSKRQILEDLEDIPGFYQTDMAQIKVKHGEQGFICNSEFLEKGLVQYDEDSLGEGYLQISEGCRAFCSFCAENWNRKPYREIKLKNLLEKALAMKAEMGLENINLFSFNFNMHAEFYPLIWELLPIFRNIGLKSQRFDMLANDPAMIEYQQVIGKNTVSAGLEGISPRLRRYLNKNLSEENLYRSLELIFKIKARQLKIFLLSTGKEEEEDFEEFDELVSRISETRKRFAALTRVIFSITPLVKFPWTPLEFDRAYAKEKHDQVISQTQKIIKSYDFESRKAMDSREYFISQVLARSADNRIINVLNDAIRETDFVYYQKISDRFFNAFLEGLSKQKLNEEDLLSGFSLAESEKKPWSIFDLGLKRKKLWDIYKKNSEFSETGAEFAKENLEKPHFSVQQLRDKVRQIKENEIQRDFCLNINEPGRGLARKYLGIVLARALMKSEKALIPYFRAYICSYWGGRENEPVWITGDDVITLSWDKNAKEILNRSLGDKNFISRVNMYLDKWAKFQGAKIKENIAFKLRIDSPYKFEGMGYFKKRSLKYTLYKNKDASYSLQFIKESLKKNIILGCSYTMKDSLDVFPGVKFNPREFFKEAFKFEGKNDWVRIKVSATALP